LIAFIGGIIIRIGTKLHLFRGEKREKPIIGVSSKIDQQLNFNYSPWDKKTGPKPNLIGTIQLIFLFENVDSFFHLYVKQELKEF